MRQTKTKSLTSKPRADEIFKELIQDWRCAEEIYHRYCHFLNFVNNLQNWEIERSHSEAVNAYGDALYFDHHRKSDQYRLYIYINELVNEMERWYLTYKNKNQHHPINHQTTNQPYGQKK